MTHAEWRKKFRNCKDKILTELIRPNPERWRQGNLMCRKTWPHPSRCMYRICPCIAEAIQHGTCTIVVDADPDMDVHVPKYPPQVTYVVRENP